MKKQYDVIIIGAGAAGLYAALQFDKNVSVLLICKRELALSNSSLGTGAALPRCWIRIMTISSCILQTR